MSSFVEICRICSLPTTNGNEADLFSNDNDYLKQIKYYFKLDIIFMDKVSTKICSTCVYELENINNFKERCIKVQKYFEVVSKTSSLQISKNNATQSVILLSPVSGAVAKATTTNDSAQIAEKRNTVIEKVQNQSYQQKCKPVVTNLPVVVLDADIVSETLRMASLVNRQKQQIQLTQYYKQNSVDLSNRESVPQGQFLGHDGKSDMSNKRMQIPFHEIVVDSVNDDDNPPDLSLDIDPLSGPLECVDIKCERTTESNKNDDFTNTYDRESGDSKINNIKLEDPLLTLPPKANIIVDLVKKVKTEVLDAQEKLVDDGRWHIVGKDKNVLLSSNAVTTVTGNNRTITSNSSTISSKQNDVNTPRVSGVISNKYEELVMAKPYSCVDDNIIVQNSVFTIRNLDQSTNGYGCDNNSVTEIFGDNYSDERVASNIVISKDGKKPPIYSTTVTGCASESSSEPKDVIPRRQTRSRTLKAKDGGKETEIRTRKNDDKFNRMCLDMKTKAKRKICKDEDSSRFPFECGVCDKRFKYSITYDDHMKEHRI